MAGVSISQELIGNCRETFQRALPFILTEKGLRHGVNAYAPNVLPAYITSVAAIEAFINESLLSRMAGLMYQNSPFSKLGKDWIEKVELRQKVLIVPELLFKWTFNSAAEPYQDFCLLVKVRNDLTHYAFADKNPKYVRTLKERGVFLMHDLERKGEFENPWAQDASCTEGIRWAHNVACDVVNEIIEHAPDKTSLNWNQSNFVRIPDHVVPSFLKSNGIDPTTDFPKAMRSS